MTIKKPETNHYLIDLEEHNDEKGSLAIIQEISDIPFQIKRLFYSYNVPGNVTRGNHANKFSKFGLISIVGSCKVEVDDGYQKTEYLLQSPNTLLFIDTMIWKQMKDFSDDNVLLVVSDQPYNRDEYITDYEEYKLLVEGLKT